MKTSPRPILALTLFAAAVVPLSPLHAQDHVPDDRMPLTQQGSGIRYLTGGVGIDSAASMRALRPSYPVAVTFVYHEGSKNQFTAGVGVTVERPDGTPLLEVVTEGPYLFIDLPEGSYRLRARSTLGGPQQKEFRVTPGRRTEFSVIWEATP